MNKDQYDSLLGALMRATTISDLADIDRQIEDALALTLISCDQVALLRRSLRVREDRIAELATI